MHQVQKGLLHLQRRRQEKVLRMSKIWKGLQVMLSSWKLQQLWKRVLADVRCLLQSYFLKSINVIAKL